MATFAQSPEGLSKVEVPGYLNYGLDIDDYIAKNNPALAAAKIWMDDTRKLAEGFNVRRATVDEEITAAKNLSDISKAADGLSEKVSAGYAKQLADVTAGKAQAQAAVDAKVALAPSANAAEIRSVFRSMSDEARAAAMAAAFKDGDKEVLAALVSAPALTHGCDRDQLAAHYEAYKRNVAFGEYRVLDEYEKANRYLENCREGLLRWRADIYEGTKEHVAKREQTKALLKSYGFEVDED